MTDLSPAAFDAVTHAVYAGLSDAEVPFDQRQRLAEALLDEILPVIRAGRVKLYGASHPVRFAFDRRRREPVPA